MSTSIGPKHDLDYYATIGEFHEYLDQEFDDVAAQAPLEDLAIFAFGSVEDAILAYERYKAGIDIDAADDEEQR
jgi:hypothetical protein